MADDFSSGEATNGRVMAGGPPTVGRIETADDSDWFRVDVVAGQVYRFTLTAEAAGLTEATLELLGVDDAWLDFATVRDGEPAVLNYTPGVSGSAYLTVSDFNNGTSIGGYTVSAAITGTVVVDDYADDETTTGTISIGGPAVEGVLETVGDYDAFRLELTANNPYRFIYEGELSGDPEWVLVELVDNRLVPTGTFNGGFADRPTVLDFTPEWSGTYYLGIWSAGDGRAGTGPYTVKAFSLANTTGTSGNDTLSGTSANNGLYGLAGDDVLTDGEGDDTLDGGAGADTMSGGVGSDSYVVDNEGDLVTEPDAYGRDRVSTTLLDYALPANVESGRVLAASGARFAGNGLDNVLYAGSGGDTLAGGGGADRAAFQYAEGPVNVSLAASGIQATGGAGGVLLESIERLYGSRGNDRLIGDDGANQINGGAGVDTLAGGGGNDLYVVHNAASVVEESPDVVTGGLDIVLSTARSFTLPDGVENGRVHSQGYVDLIGNAGRNLLYAGGFGSHSLLDGQGGNDTASFFYASNSVRVNLNTLGTQQTAGAGIVKLASIENLIGSKWSEDRLTGDAGNNFLNGGHGYDWLTGGAGRDVFVFSDLDFSFDFITDFVSGTDRLAIDQSAFAAVGDGDTVIDGAVSVAGSGGFAASAELVVFTDSVAGHADQRDIVAAHVGSATSAYDVGAKVLFMVNDGESSALWHFRAANADAEVSANELVMLALLEGTPATTPADFLFGP